MGEVPPLIVLAVKLATAPEQMLVDAMLIDRAGETLGITTTLEAAEVAEQPFMSVTVTL